MTATVRRSFSVACWALSGLCWVALASVSWAQSGPLSRSSLLDVAGLVRSGVLTSLPGWVPWGALLLPMLGAVLIGLAFPRWARWVRVAAFLVAVLAWWAVTREVTGFAASRWGTGPWLGVVGIGLGVVGLLVESKKTGES
ncbi:hypothetical protein [Nocardioides daejeonensis]|uniref:hypothetical protein n=1 Tax=Nocardioides daejeonensis TaxID=1046556 RepID=UPI000D743211|nr:hypothetical protein [Nocardioides daejeonensis]